MKKHLLTGVGFLSAILFAAVLALGPAPAETPIEEAGDASVPAEIPTEARNRRNPVTADQDSIGKGQSMFASQCAMCHGATGDGSGDLGQTLKLTMPDFTSAAHQKTRTDGELFYILSKGHGKMPAETRLNEKTRWDLVNGIRAMAENP